jgi:hypothetical protein
MPNITVVIPDQYIADAVAVAKTDLGEEADGLADNAAIKKLLTQWMEGRILSRRLVTVAAVTDAVANAETAALAKVAEADTADATRQNAEDAEQSAVASAFRA